MDKFLLESSPEHKESRDLYLRWRILELVSGTLSTLGIITSTIDYEVNFSTHRNHHNCAENTFEVYRWLTFCFTLLAALFLVLRHWVKVNWYNNRPIQLSHSKKDAITKRKQIKKKKQVLSRHFFLELLILSIFPYPTMRSTFSILQSVRLNKNDGIDEYVHLCYTVSELFYVFIYIRLLFLLRALFNFTPYQDNHARYYCARYGTKANVRFSIRCMLRTRPFFMIMLFILPSFFVLGIFLRVFERPYGDVSELNFDSYLNSVWCCAVTMATIGYGDLYPGTLFGRIVAVLCAMWGAFAFSMIVFTLESSLQFTENQNKAFNAITRTRAAARTILESLVYNVVKKRHGCFSEQAKTQMKKVRKRLAKFLNTLKLLNSTYSRDRNQDKNKERFKKLNKHIQVIEEKLDRVLGRYE